MIDSLGGKLIFLIFLISGYASSCPTILPEKSEHTIAKMKFILLRRKKVTINGGGSYITLDVNAIESATAGEYRTKAGHYGRKKKASEPKDFPNVAPETTEPSSKFNFS